MQNDILTQILLSLNKLNEEVLSIRREMATKEDLKRFATKEDLEEVKRDMATKEDLEEVKRNMATKEDLEEVKRNMATKEDLEEVKRNMATKKELAQMREDMSTKEDLNKLAREVVDTIELMNKPHYEPLARRVTKLEKRVTTVEEHCLPKGS